MPPSRRRTSRSRLEQLRAELIRDLDAAHQTAHEFVEAYVVSDNIERLEDDRIVPRFARLLVYFSSEIQQMWGDAEHTGWQPPVDV
jgi:hypothetical protein